MRDTRLVRSQLRFRLLLASLLLLLLLLLLASLGLGDLLLDIKKLRTRRTVDRPIVSQTEQQRRL